MSDYESYANVRDAATIAKFLSRVASHSEKLELHKRGHAEFPRHIAKDAKWPAYEAAGRIIRSLNLDIYASSVEDLAVVLGKALAAR